LELKKKPQASHSQSPLSPAPGNRSKLTLGLKKKQPTNQPLSLKKPTVPTKHQKETTLNKPRIKGKLEVNLKINERPNWVASVASVGWVERGKSFGETYFCFE